jgi:hypothetical protein
MPYFINFSWMYFCIAFGITLLISFIMSFQDKEFYLMHVVMRKFNIIDLEFPASAEELVSVIKDIYRLPAELSKKTIRALKNQLYLDFLFMPALYGSVFILSMKVSMKMMYVGHKLFAVLAWLQLVSWVCDIIENIYLLNKIRPQPVVSKPAVHIAYEILEIVKWGIPLITLVCSLAAIFYYWIVGNYSYNSLLFTVVVIVEIIVFFGLKKLTSKTEKQKLEDFEGATNSKSFNHAIKKTLVLLLFYSSYICFFSNNLLVVSLQ